MLALGCGTAQHTQQRTAIANGGDASWELAIRPLFARACTPCHLKDGESGIDFTTASAWRSRRDDVRRSVVVDKTMPPFGHPFSDAERETVRVWLDGTK